MATIGGTNSNDSLAGTSGNDTLNGLGGNDTLVASGGSDFYDGGSGSDTLDLRAALGAVAVNFSAGALSGAFNGTFVNIERVLGSNAGDSLIGAAGSQTLSGRAGNDTLAGGAGNDTLWGGGDGNHFVFRELGLANADRISDFAFGSDKIVLDAAVMTALGASGNFASGDARFAANSSGTAQDASDRVIFNTTTQQLFYDADGDGLGASAQLIATLQSGATFLDTNIVVEGSGTPALPPKPIQGTSGDDSLVGGPSNDTINGLDGNDILRGDTGNDSLDGGLDNDFLAGDAGDDVLSGGEGVDTLLGGIGSDYLSGGAGDDVLGTTHGPSEPSFPLEGDVDSLYGGFGNDTYVGVGINTVLYDEGGTDTVRVTGSWTLGPGFENLSDVTVGIGNELDNVITGISSFRGSNTLDGADGNDTLIGGAGSSDTFRFAAGSGNIGHDHVDGGGPWVYIDGSVEYSVEWLDYSGARSGVTVDLSTGTGSGGGTSGSGALTFANIDNVIGSEFDDRLIAHDGMFSGWGFPYEGWDPQPDIVGAAMDGGGGNDTLIGGASIDDLSGDGGSDWLDAGAGQDWLHGGTGADSYAFTAPAGSADADSILDFESGIDVVLLDTSVFDNLGLPGRFTSTDPRFRATTGSTAHDEDDRIVYDTGSGALYYDSDGSGTGAPSLQFAIVPGLASTDINVGLTVIDGGPAGSGQLVSGTSGDDNLLGSEGRDTVEGLAGNDTLAGSGEVDLLRGGDGKDELFGRGVADTLEGGAGDDTYYVIAPDPASSPEVLVESSVVESGVDTVWWRPEDPGFDLFPAWDFGEFTLGPGFENLVLSPQWDPMATGLRGIGNSLDNVISGSGGFDRISAMEGNDSVSGGWGGDTIDGGDGNDTLNGGEAADSIYGGDGNDSLDGSLGTDSLSGGAGADSFIFTTPPDAPATAGNTDSISDFSSGVDKIVLDGLVYTNVGASGAFTASDPRFFSTPDPGFAQAHDATDRVVYNTSSGYLYYDADGSVDGGLYRIAILQGAPALVATDISIINGSTPPPSPPDEGEIINGTSAADTLAGTSGNDTLNGLGGNDLFLGGSTVGADVIDGGAGHDSIEFKAAATSAMMVDFGAGTISGGSAGSLSFTNVERVVGGNFNDTLTGNGASQTLTGQAGSDTIMGAGGTDTLWGGSGADVFVFAEMGTAHADRISDFTTTSDKVHLDDAAFSAIGAMGNFAADDERFWAAPGAIEGHDETDRVVYNTSSGTLYYDANGSATGAVDPIATLQSGAKLAATDIVVI